MTNQKNDRERRREQALERLGTRTPKCALCDERDPAALTGTHPDILCYQHRSVAQGRRPVEEDHVVGRHNDPGGVMPMRGNHHRVRSDLQRDWPARTLQNPDESPVLVWAAAVRTAVDWLRILIDRVLGGVARGLESLDAALTLHLGPRWWEQIGWTP